MYFQSIIIVIFLMSVFIECFSPYDDDYEYDTISRQNGYGPLAMAHGPRRYIATKSPRYYIKCTRTKCE